MVKPSIPTEALHPHLVQFGPSCGLYPSPPGRVRGRAPSDTAAQRLIEPLPPGRRAAPNPLIDVRRPR